MTGVAWAPDLPGHWSAAHLRWLATIFAGGTPDRANPDYWTDGTIPWLNSGAVNDWSITEPSEHISEAGFTNSSARWVPPRSVVIGLAGQGKTKGTSARMEITATTNQSMAAIVPGPSLDYRFLHYWLVANYQSIRNLAGGDLRDGLNLQHIGSIECPLPSVDEQRAIADHLDHETAQIDTLIAKQEQLIVTLRERRATVVSDVVWRGLNDHRDGEDHREPWSAAPAPWKRVRNKQILQEVSDLSTDGSEEMLSVSHLTGVTPRSEKTVTMFEAESQVGYRKVEAGDLVINTMWAWMGALGTSKRSGIVSPAYGVYRARLDADFDPRYFDAFYRSRAYVDIMTVHSTGIWSSRLRLYPNVFLALPVLVPPIEEQRAIARHIEERTLQIDTLIAKAERFIDLSKERRAALITAAVTGQIDVRGGAA